MLDTGLDLNHPTVQASPPTGRRNFLTGDENVYDQDGHGTFVTGLLMDDAPHAEIFVGKISEGNVVAGTDIIADVSTVLPRWKQTPWEDILRLAKQLISGSRRSVTPSINGR